MSQWRAYCARVEENRDLLLEAVRVYLGIALFVRALVFFTEAGDVRLMSLLETADPGWMTSVIVVHYIIMAHLAGGLLLAIGLLTRLAALVQIPILAGAVFLIHWEEGLFALGQNLELSALTLFLLIIVFLHGGGRWSVDRYVFRKGEER